MSKTKKILCLFDYGVHCYTGFATVSRNIKKEVKKALGNDIQLDICAINHFDDAYREEDGTFVFSAKLNDVKEDDFGRFLFMKVLQDAKDYDGIFIMQDITVICPIIEILEHIKREKKERGEKLFKSIFYFPIDCKIIPKTTDGLEFFDSVITYTEYGRKELLRLRPDLKSKIKVIPHGNSNREYYQISKEDSIEFRKEWFGEENFNKFIITNINRNQARKDIPNTIFGFLEARKMWKEQNLPNEPFLYLHMHPKDPMGWDIRAIFMQIEELREGRDYMLLPELYETTICPIEIVNKIYNASDVYLSTTLGEGWGLSLSEAAATKLPIIAPYSTSFIEMSGYGKRGYMLETLYPSCNMTNVIREQTDIYEVAEKLIEVGKAHYNIEGNDLMKSKVEEAYKWVNSLNWESVCKLWIKYFKETY
jgi:glycosyltransferase involved in cell wall biosynthesis